MEGWEKGTALQAHMNPGKLHSGGRTKHHLGFGSAELLPNCQRIELKVFSSRFSPPTSQSSPSGQLLSVEQSWEEQSSP